MEPDGAVAARAEAAEASEMQRFRLEERRAESICQKTNVLSQLANPAVLYISGRLIVAPSVA